MPYALPTAIEFKARFPDFDAVLDLIVDEHIADAGNSVSIDWIESDYQRGIMFLAAHYMVEEGYTGRSIDESGPIVSTKLGDGSDTYGQYQNVDTDGIYSSSAYGRRFMQLRRANTQGVRLL